MPQCGESDPEEDLEDDDDEDPEEDLVDYPADERRTTALLDSKSLLQLRSCLLRRRTEPFETDVSCGPHHTTMHIALQARFSIPACLLQYGMQRLSSQDNPVESRGLLLPSTYHLTPPSGTPSLLPIPAPTSLPPLLLPFTTHREDRHEVCLPPQKRLCFAFGPRYEVEESSSAVAARPTGGLRVDYGFVATLDDEIIRDLERDVRYGITDAWDEIVEAMQGTPVVTDVAEFSQRMTEFETRLMAGRLNMLYKDRRAHARTARLMKTEARMSREAWGRSMDASDLARADVMSLCTTVLAQQSVIIELQAADRRRQAVITKMLAADCQRQAQFIEALKLLKRL
ncbi:hypothetical protein Tco_1160795 [Tanacetum coccineum]